MAKQETNFIEIILRSAVIGMTIYDNDDSPIEITDLNYDPKVQTVYLTGTNSVSYKLHITDNFDFEYTQLSKIKPAKQITGQRLR